MPARQMEIEEAYERIMELTNTNGHTEAVWVLAQFAGHAKWRRIMDAALALQQAYGELPPGVQEIRAEARKACIDHVARYVDKLAPHFSAEEAVEFLSEAFGGSREGPRSPWYR